MAKSHDNTGRSINGWKPARQAKRARPPEGASWIWLTRNMLESPAWRAMRLAARKVVDRLIVEYLTHGGRENGELITTYSDFQRFGVRRPSIAPAITEIEALGFVDVVQRGGSAYAEFRNPSRYALAWLDRKDGTPPTNRWKAFETVADARKAVRAALVAPKPKKATIRKNKKPGTETHKAGYESVSESGYGSVTNPNKKPDPKSLLLSIFSLSPTDDGP